MPASETGSYRAACAGYLWAIEAAYVRLLRLPIDHPLRLSSAGQSTLAGLREFIVTATGVDAETVQNAMETKAASQNYTEAQ